jgi:hypothetical protein
MSKEFDFAESARYIMDIKNIGHLVEEIAMKHNDEMDQMFSKQGLMAAYIYLILMLAGYTFWQSVHGRMDPFWLFVMSSQGMIWIIATQVLKRRKLGKGGLSAGAWITLITASGLLLLLLFTYGIVFLDWMMN